MVLMLTTMMIPAQVMLADYAADLCHGVGGFLLGSDYPWRGQRIWHVSISPVYARPARRPAAGRAD